jgi:WD40 repeat protein
MSSRLKELLNDSIITMFKLFDDFYFMMDHQEFYLDNQILEIKNNIDIHREELIEKIHKISDEMMASLDKYFSNCMCHVKKLEEIKLKNKSDLDDLKHYWQSKQNEIEKNDENGENDFKIQLQIDEINRLLKEKKTKMFDYEKQIKMQQKLIFEPIYLNDSKDIFGRLIFQDIDFMPNKETGKFIKSFKNNKQDRYNCMELLFQNRLAVANQNRIIKIYNLNKGFDGPIKTLQGHLDDVTVLKSHSKHILTSGSIDGTIKMWDLIREKCIETLYGHQLEVTDLCFYSNNLISSSIDSTILIWDLNSYQILTILVEHTNPVNFLRLNSKQKLISSSSDLRIKIWDLNNDYSCIKTIFTGDEKINSLELTNDDNILIHVHLTVKLLDGLTGICLRSFDVFGEDKSYCDHYVRLFPNDNNLFVSVFSPTCPMNRFNLKIWGLNEEKCIFEMNGAGVFRDLRISHNRNMICLHDWVESDNFRITSIKILNMN